MIYQFSLLSPHLEASAFVYGFQYVMGGCLVPLIVSLNLSEGHSFRSLAHTAVVYRACTPRSSSSYARSTSLFMRGGH